MEQDSDIRLNKQLNIMESNMAKLLEITKRSVRMNEFDYSIDILKSYIRELEQLAEPPPLLLKIQSEILPLIIKRKDILLKISQSFQKEKPKTPKSIRSSNAKTIVIGNNERQPETHIEKQQHQLDREREILAQQLAKVQEKQQNQLVKEREKMAKQLAKAQDKQQKQLERERVKMTHQFAKEREIYQKQLNNNSNNNHIKYVILPA